MITTLEEVYGVEIAISGAGPPASQILGVPTYPAVPTTCRNRGATVGGSPGAVVGASI